MPKTPNFFLQAPDLHVSCLLSTLRGVADPLGAKLTSRCPSSPARAPPPFSASPFLPVTWARNLGTVLPPLPLSPFLAICQPCSWLCLRDASGAHHPSPGSRHGLLAGSLPPPRPRSSVLSTAATGVGISASAHTIPWLSPTCGGKAKGPRPPWSLRPAHPLCSCRAGPSPHLPRGQLPSLRTLPQTVLSA